MPQDCLNQFVRHSEAIEVGSQAAAIGDPGGGATIDLEARACLAGVLAALRGHGLIAG